MEPSPQQEQFHAGLLALAERDPELADCLTRRGMPSFWCRPAGLAALIRIILEQQVSLRSARSVFQRLTASIDPSCPEALLELKVDGLRSLGFTRQKAGYVIGLAKAILTNELDLAALSTLNDDQAFEALVRLKGIGPWSASVYLLSCLGRPDIWPPSDLALAIQVAKIKRLQQRPDKATLTAISDTWRPYRSWAARLLWYDYLGGSWGAMLDD